MRTPRARGAERAACLSWGLDVDSVPSHGPRVVARKLFARDDAPGRRRFAECTRCGFEGPWADVHPRTLLERIGFVTPGANAHAHWMCPMCGADAGHLATDDARAWPFYRWDGPTPYVPARIAEALHRARPAHLHRTRRWLNAVWRRAHRRVAARPSS